MIMAQFHAFAQILLDRIYQSFFSSPQFEGRSHGMEHIQSALKGKRGLVLMTAHNGAWDLAASLLTIRDLSEFVMVRYDAVGISVFCHAGSRVQICRRIARRPAVVGVGSGVCAGSRRFCEALSLAVGQLLSVFFDGSI